MVILCFVARYFSQSSLGLNLLSSYCGPRVLQSNCSQTVEKDHHVLLVNICTTLDSPEMGGLRPAAGSALGISGNLIPSCLDIGCERPHALALHPVLCECKTWFAIPTASQSMFVGVTSLGFRSSKTTGLEMLLHGAGEHFLRKKAFPVLVEWSQLS